MRFFSSLILIMGIITSYSQVDLTVNLSSNQSSYKTGELVIYTIDFGIASTTSAGQDVVITTKLPEHIKFKSLATSSYVSSYTIDPITNELEIKLINPIPAGISGSLQINAYLDAFHTPNGLSLTNTATIQASNAITNNVISNATSITTEAIADYLIFKQVESYNPLTKQVTWKVLLDYKDCNDSIGKLSLEDVVLKDSITNGGKFVSATQGGMETFPGSGIVQWDFTHLQLADWCSKQYTSVEITVDYSSSPLGTLVSNYGMVEGTLPSNIPFKIQTSALKQLTPPSSGIDCGSNFSENMLFAASMSPSILNSNITPNVPHGSVRYPLTYTGTNSLDSSEIIIPVPNEVATDLVFIPFNTEYELYYTTNLQVNKTLLAQGSTAQNIFPPTLPVGEYIDQFYIKMKNIPSGTVEEILIVYSILETDRQGNKVYPVNYNTPNWICLPEYTCITFEYDVNSWDNTTTYNSTCSLDIMPVDHLYPVIHEPKKTISGNQGPYNPGDTLTFELSFNNYGVALINPVIFDTLAPVLEYITNSTTLDFFDMMPIQGGDIQVSYTNQVLKIQPLPDSATFPSLITTISYKAIVKAHSPSGTYWNKFNGVADNYPIDTLLFDGALKIEDSIQFIVNEINAITAKKGVKGQLDNQYQYFPNEATTTNGSDISYQLTLKNEGTTLLKDLVMVDPLPYDGDMNGSLFTPFITSLPVLNNPNIVPYYSLDSNICITEVSPPITPTGCNIPTWTTTPPTDWKNIRALKFEFNDKLKGGDSIIATWNMSASPSLNSTDVAYNQFHYQGKKDSDNSLLLLSSPNKVGINIASFATIGEYVWIDTDKNGFFNTNTEEGINNVTVEIWSLGVDNTPNTSDDQLIADTLTSTNKDGIKGSYKFYVDPGVYFLKFIVDGCVYEETTLLTGGDFITSDFIVQSNELVLDKNLGLCPSTLTIVGTGDLCVGGQHLFTSTLTATSNNYTYQWQHTQDLSSSWVNIPSETNVNLSISPIALVDSGYYRLIVTELGTTPVCEIISDTLSFSPFTTSFVLNVTAPDICSGQSITLEQIGTTTGSFFWYNSLTDLVPKNNPYTTPSLTSSTTFYIDYKETCHTEKQPVLVNVITCSEPNEEQIFFPTGFSPNLDNINDSYIVYHVPEGLTLEVSFYNRWGNLVYHNDDYQNDWKGECTEKNCSGDLLPSSTYALIAKLSNGQNFSLEVTLIR